MVGFPSGENVQPPTPTGWTNPNAGVPYGGGGSLNFVPPATAPCATKYLIGSSGVSGTSLQSALNNYCSAGHPAINITPNANFVTFQCTGYVMQSQNLTYTATPPTGYGSCNGSGVATLSDPSSVPYPSDGVPSYFRSSPTHPANGACTGVYSGIDYCPDTRDPDNISAAPLPVNTPPAGQSPTPFSITGQDGFGNPVNIGYTPTGDGGGDLTPTVQTTNPLTGKPQTQSGTSHINRDGVVTSAIQQPVQTDTTLPTALAQQAAGGSNSNTNPVISTVGLAQDSTLQQTNNDLLVLGSGVAGVRAAVDAGATQDHNDLGFLAGLIATTNNWLQNISQVLSPTNSFNATAPSVQGLTGGLSAGYAAGVAVLCSDTGGDCTRNPSCSTGLCNSSERLQQLSSAFVQSSTFSNGVCPTVSIDLSSMRMGVHTLNYQCIFLESLRSTLVYVGAFMAALSFVFIVMDA